MSPTTRPTILLVHGAWHGSWCWKYQIPALEALGYAVASVDLPCTSGVAGTTQFDDAATVRVALEALLAAGKQVVVLAHSYGGPIGSAAIAGLSAGARAAAGHPSGMLGLVALCAYIFPGGMDQGAVIRDAGSLEYVTWDVPAAGLLVPKDPRAMFFPPDAPADRVAWALPQLRPQSSAAVTGIVPPQAWQDDAFAGRLGYIRCTADVIVPLAQQDGMIEGAGGRDRWVVRTLEGSGHSPHLSRPDEVAAAVDEIIEEFEKASSRK